MLTHCKSSVGLHWQVFTWMMSNWLQLMPAKTEVLWCSSAQHQHQILTCPVRVGDTSVLRLLLVQTVQELGVHSDADGRCQYQCSCHYNRQSAFCSTPWNTVCVIRWHILTTLLTLMHVHVVTKVDYCSSVLSGISGQMLQWLHSVFNAATRLHVLGEEVRALNSTPPWTTLAESLERIQFRLCVLTFRCLNGMAPSYLTETLHLTADTGSCRRFRSASTSTLAIPSTWHSTLGE